MTGGVFRVTPVELVKPDARNSATSAPALSAVVNEVKFVFNDTIAASAPAPRSTSTSKVTSMPPFEEGLTNLMWMNVGGTCNSLAMAVLNAAFSASPNEEVPGAGAPSDAAAVAAVELEFSPATVYPAKLYVTSTATAGGAAGFTLHFMSHDPNTFSLCRAEFFFRVMTRFQ